MTRRQFGAKAGAVALAAQAGKHSLASTTVDQNPIRRRGTGLRALDRERASPGLTLFSPMNGDGTVYLIDLDGKPAHTWRMPYRPGLYGYLTERGTLFYNGKIPNSSFIGRTPFMGGVALEADWNGSILWEVRNPHHHHDGRLLKNGNVLLLCAAELPADVSASIRGGRPGTEVQGKIWADYLVEITTAGQLVWEWRIWEHLDPAEYPITFPEDDRSEWTHGNTVFEQPDGDLLVSLRNISTVVRIDRRTGSVVWKISPPLVSGQHAPVLLRNGNILIFDNGPHRLDHMFPFSRVIEVNPATREIVWQYQEAFPQNFYSDRISNAQRLANGNTLINEGIYGRFFEVTPAGEVVWEYVNPYFGPAASPSAQQSNSVFRVYRYTVEELAKVRNVRNP